MRQRVRNPHILQHFAAQAAKRAAGRRQDQASNFAWRIPPQALVNGGMLGIHRDDAHSSSACLRHDHVPGGHQGFLVGQGHIGARSQSRHGRQDPRRSDKRVDHDASRRRGGRRGESLRTREHFDAGATRANNSRLFFCIHYRQMRLKLVDQIRQIRHARVRRQRAHVETIPVQPQNLKRLPAD